MKALSKVRTKQAKTLISRHCNQRNIYMHNTLWPSDFACFEWDFELSKVHGYLETLGDLINQVASESDES